MKIRGYTLVELMMVVAIIGILAAASLPLYTRFKNKASVTNAIKACLGTTSAFQVLYDDQGTFDAITITQEANGWRLSQNGAVIGSNLPLIDVDNFTWEVIGNGNDLELAWSFGNSPGCPTATCDGKYCLTCDENGCLLELKFLTNELGLDRADNGPVC